MRKQRSSCCQCRQCTRSCLSLGFPGACARMIGASQLLMIGASSSQHSRDTCQTAPDPGRVRVLRGPLQVLIEYSRPWVFSSNLRVKTPQSMPAKLELAFLLAALIAVQGMPAVEERINPKYRSTDGSCYAPECVKPPALYERILHTKPRIQWDNAGGCTHYRASASRNSRGAL